MPTLYSTASNIMEIKGSQEKIKRFLKYLKFFDYTDYKRRLQRFN
jgi:hypothetical protein